MKRLAGWLAAPFWFLVALVFTARVLVPWLQSIDTLDNRREVQK